MTTYSGQLEQESRGGVVKILFLLLFVFFAVVFGGIGISRLFPLLPNIHDMEKHGADTVIVDDCLKSLGHLEMWKHKTNGRIARICEVQKNLFGVRIDADQSWLNKITGFVKEKLNALWKVERYLNNSGYECIQGCEGIIPGEPR